MRKALRIGAAALAGVAALFASACSGRRLLEGETPFPAKSPVMVDAAGTPLADLPRAVEPLRLIVLDFPWCPPCADAWDAIAKCSQSVRASELRVYRILFDREKFDSASGSAETAPLRPAPPPPALAFPVTTLTALPAAFRERFRVDQAPVLLLADAQGRVLKRWTGFTPALADALREEVGRRQRLLAPAPAR